VSAEVLSTAEQLHIATLQLKKLATGESFNATHLMLLDSCPVKPSVIVHSHIFSATLGNASTA